MLKNLKLSLVFKNLAAVLLFGLIGLTSFSSTAFAQTGFGQAIELTNGSTANDVSVPNSFSTELSSLNAFTIEAWIKPDAPTTIGIYSIVSKGTGSWHEYDLGLDALKQNDGSIKYNYVFGIGDRANNCGLTSISNWGEFGQPEVVSSSNYSSWKHVAAVFQYDTKTVYAGGGQFVNFYIFENGKQVSSGKLLVENPDCYSALPANYNGDVVIGARHEDIGSYYSQFNGQIDEVRLSNVARYTANFTPVTTPFTPDNNTVGLYHLDNNAKDASSSNNNGQIDGNVQFINSMYTVIAPATVNMTLSPANPMTNQKITYTASAKSAGIIGKIVMQVGGVTLNSTCSVANNTMTCTATDKYTGQHTALIWDVKVYDQNGNLMAHKEQVFKVLQPAVLTIAPCDSTSCGTITTAIINSVGFNDPITVAAKGLTDGILYGQAKFSSPGVPYATIAGKTSTQLIVDFHGLPCDQSYMAQIYDPSLNITKETNSFAPQNICLK